MCKNRIRRCLIRAIAKLLTDEYCHNIEYHVSNETPIINDIKAKEVCVTDDGEMALEAIIIKPERLYCKGSDEASRRMYMSISVAADVDKYLGDIVQLFTQEELRDILKEAMHMYKKKVTV